MIAKLFPQSILRLTYQRQTPVTANFINNLKKELRDSLMGMFTVSVACFQPACPVGRFSVDCLCNFYLHSKFLNSYSYCLLRIAYCLFPIAPNLSYLVCFSCAYFIISTHAYFSNNANGDKLYATK